MTDQEMIALKMMWGRIAPQEPNAYDARCMEVKWEIENIYHIKGFFAPDTEDDGLDYVQWKQAQNEAYDAKHQG